MIQVDSNRRLLRSSLTLPLPGSLQSSTLQACSYCRSLWKRHVLAAVQDLHRPGDFRTAVALTMCTLYRVSTN